MNDEDQAFYARKEFDRNVDLQRAELATLREHGAVVRLRSNAGSVAVNAFGVVTEIRLDKKNTEFIAEATLAGYLVEAFHAAEKRARTRREEILARKVAMV